MTYYYELLSDGSIGHSTPFKAVAENLGLKLTTEEEIIYGCDDKKYFKGQEPTPPKPNYIEKRIAEYPPITEQLDMIYWDKMNNTENWKNTISEIKAKYPKE